MIGDRYGGPPAGRKKEEAATAAAEAGAAAGASTGAAAGAASEGEATGSRTLTQPPRAGPPHEPVGSWLPEILEASRRMPMPPPRQPAGLALMDAVETFTARVLRAGNDNETLGTYSTSWAEIRKEYKEATNSPHGARGIWALRMGF